MDTYSLLGRRIREERAAAGLTLEALAEQAGITPAYVAHIEAARKKATLATAAALAKALDISLPDLLSDPAQGKSDENARYFVRINRILKGKSPKRKSRLLDVLAAAARL